MRRERTEYFASEAEALDRKHTVEASAVQGYSEVYVTGPSYDEDRKQWRIGVTKYSG